MERESNNSKQSIKEIASLSLGAVILIVSAVFVFSIVGTVYFRLITNSAIYPPFLRR